MAERADRNGDWVILDGLRLPVSAYGSLLRAGKGHIVVDAMLLCPCRASELRDEPRTGPCGCLGPPPRIARVVPVEVVAKLLEALAEAPGE